MVNVPSQPRVFTAADVERLISPSKARDLLRRALSTSFDPSEDPARLILPTPAGQLLVMPSVIDGWAGTKIASLAPGNAQRGLPRIHATYVLMEPETLQICALIDGQALTTLRTPAVSALAAELLLTPQESASPRRLVVFGTGPQGLGHVEAFAALCTLSDVAIVGRNSDTVASSVGKMQEKGIPARAGDAADVRTADIIVCATSARTPLFEAADVPDHAVIVAMGSHEPDARELPGDLFQNAYVVVEDVATALREAGDVIMAIEEGHLTKERLVDLRSLVADTAHPDTQHPRIFKGTGMSWQDLAVATGMMEKTPR
ncbi:ornithine cyclodeaminase family protein [Corynebacterium pseudotuberculosis]|uniref:Ornithine cyclodeaminase family protein n=1 Tax=Corynebacterium pseudotuberculosis 258 TaxID=1168865 RepID=A0AAU8PNQ8_CORPS|nr:ornithine cyclodeaminase family protein [Corynebacterium pseudotuberculosis]AER69608.1 Ornithine cyclodeaminase [Corynebacterium pseudotuberculosis 1/06-A]AEQ07121.1 ornithine cyclodeaminase family protein [Corynebacterium pseudotuberculosis CIP 52.97]AFB72929.1 ornithine cyclodeaminase family protein [Corynebacterium pseudotuberculosis 316]AFH91390.1 ornithine cyclodeaminase family protein [Corynebacterium pseudotuberculosis 31]AFK17218.1 ornithine cyclodeaminase family protein [Corynebact